MLILQKFNLFLFFLGNLNLPFQVLSDTIELLFLAVRTFKLLIYRLLFLSDGVFTLVEIIIFTVDLLFMLGFHLQELLLCFKKLILLDYLSIQLCIFKDLFYLVLGSCFMIFQ